MNDEPEELTDERAKITLALIAQEFITTKCLAAYVGCITTTINRHLEKTGAGFLPLGRGERLWSLQQIGHAIEMQGELPEIRKITLLETPYGYGHELAGSYLLEALEAKGLIEVLTIGGRPMVSKERMDRFIEECHRGRKQEDD